MGVCVYVRARVCVRVFVHACVYVCLRVCVSGHTTQTASQPSPYPLPSCSLSAGRARFLPVQPLVPRMRVDELHAQSFARGMRTTLT